MIRLPTINQVSLVGRLAQDPEFRITENGTARLTGRIAVNRSYRNAQDEWIEEASFFNLSIWGRLAERAADRLQKGMAVFLSGRLRSHTWRDDQENPHSLVEVVVRNYQILESHEGEEGEESACPGVVGHG